MLYAQWYKAWVPSLVVQSHANYGPTGLQEGTVPQGYTSVQLLITLNYSEFQVASIYSCMDLCAESCWLAWKAPASSLHVLINKMSFGGQFFGDYSRKSSLITV